MTKPESRFETDPPTLRLHRDEHDDGRPHQENPPNGRRQTEPARRTDRQQRELDRMSGTADAKTVSVSVRSLVPLLMDAAERDRTWLRDFADDSVRIDVDLYDVLLAYQKLSQSKAA